MNYYGTHVPDQLRLTQPERSGRGTTQVDRNILKNFRAKDGFGDMQKASRDEQK